jgi:dihydrodipicolinate synthase/N-acetylneuraminate lyase
VTARRPEGVFAPVTTPFDPQRGDIVAAPFRDNIERLLGAGLNGILVAGSTGEAALLDPAEQEALVRWARAVIPKDRWLLAGTGAESTRQAVALTRAAAAAGADAVLVRPPGYFSAALTPASLGDYYRAIADASPIPLLVYNIPKYTHVAVPPALLTELARHERIVGVKDSSGDVQNLAAYRAAVPGWSVLVGSASLLYPALAMGCDGGVVGVACFAARACVELYAAFRAGDTARAKALQERIGPLDKAIVGAFGPAGIKAAMDAVGLHGGPPRVPLAPLTPADRERVARLVVA